MAARQDKAQVAEKLADHLRNAVETAQGKVDYGGQLTWLDYARGKDLARYLRGKPELMELLARPAGPERGIDDVVRDAVVQLVQRKLLLPCDRKFKKPHPGRTKLVKWPRTLEALRDDEFRQDAFYAWTRERPRSAWFYFASFLVVLGIVAVTLFPLAPQWLKLCVMYMLMGLLGLLLGTMLMRYVVWAVVYITTASHLWILPNLTSETVPITELFTPVISFERGAPGDAQLLARGVLLAALLCGGYALARTAPDAGTVKSRVKDAHSSLMDFLDINLAKRGLAGGANETANTTTTTGGAARDTASGAGTAKRQRARAAKEEAARQQEQRDRGRDREDDDSEAEQEATPSGTAGGGEEAEL